MIRDEADVFADILDKLVFVHLYMCAYTLDICNIGAVCNWKYFLWKRVCRFPTCTLIRGEISLQIRKSIRLNAIEVPGTSYHIALGLESGCVSEPIPDAVGNWNDPPRCCWGMRSTGLVLVHLCRMQLHACLWCMRQSDLNSTHEKDLVYSCQRNSRGEHFHADSETGYVTLVRRCHA